MIIFTHNINEEFTKAVNELLAKGMTFYTTMSGSSGETMKVDVTDGKDVYRVILERGHDHSEDRKNRFCGDTFELTVRVFKDAYKDSFDSFYTLWNRDGEELLRKTWYSIDDSYRRSVFTDNREEAIACKNKRCSRLDFNDDEVMEIIPANDEQRTFLRDMCRKTRGYKRVKRADIRMLVVRRTSSGVKSYKVYFVENKYNDLFIK